MKAKFSKVIAFLAVFLTVFGNGFTGFVTPALAASAGISPSSKNFGTVVEGYSPVAAQQFTISRSGTGTISNLAATLTGANSTSFTISSNLSRTSLDRDHPTAYVSVKPNDNLPAGTYSATLQVSNGTGGGSTTITASLTFTVTAVTYTATLTPASATFTNRDEGYGQQSTLDFTLDNTGTGRITGATATLSSGSTYFEFTDSQFSNNINPNDGSKVSVRPKTGLAAGTYNGTLSVTADNGIALSSSLSFTVNAPNPAISVNPTALAFADAVFGYTTAPTAKTVTISHTGTNGGFATGLTAVLSGGGNSDFTVSSLSRAYFDASHKSDITLTVRPKTGLAVGTHTDTLTIDGSNVDPQTVTVSFTVTPSYSATLTPASQTFPVATQGYSSAPAAQTFTFTNTGTGTIGSLSAALTTGSSNFNIGTLSATSLDGGQSATVTVQPKTGLAAGTYNGKLTITGDHSISKEATFSFTVNPTGSLTLTKILYSETSNDPGNYANNGETFTFTLTPSDKNGNKIAGATPITKTLTWGNAPSGQNWRPTGTVQSASNFANGKAEETFNLDYGYYVLEEASNPDYRLVGFYYWDNAKNSNYTDGQYNANGYTGKIVVNIDSTAAKVYMKNTRLKGNVTVTKSFSGGYAPTGNITFTMTRSDGTEYERTLYAANWATTKTVTFSNLPRDTYTLTETMSGSDVGKYNVTIDNSGTVVLNSSSKNVGVTNTRKTGDVTVTKTFGGSYAPTGDITFTLTNSSTNAVLTQVLESDTWATIKAVTFNDVPYGSYTLTETMSGSDVGKYDVAIDNNGAVAVDSATESVGVTNTRKTGDVTVTKTFGGSYAPTGDITFTLTNSSTNAVLTQVLESDTWATIKAVTFNDVPYGSYTLTETMSGSDVGKYDVAIDNNGAVAVDSATESVGVTNTRKIGSIKVAKAFDPNTDAEIDVTFSLYKGGVFQQSQTLHWPTDSYVTFTGLAYDDDYTVTETSSDGYTSSMVAVTGTDMNSDGVITVNGNEEIDVTNTARTGSIALHKALEAGSTAPDDVIFQVTVTATDNPSDTHTVNLTAGGTETVSGLVYGKTYTVTEDLTDTNFAQVSIEQTGGDLEFSNGQFTVTGDGDNDLSLALTITNKQLGAVSFNKVVPNYTYGEGDTVPSFKFKLTGPEGFTTRYIDADANGATRSVSGLPYGTYTLTEVAAGELDGYTYPAGYTYDSNPFTFTVDATHKTFGLHTFNNTAQGGVRILKLDSRSHTSEAPIPVPGTTFSLFNADNVKLDEGTSDANGLVTFSNLDLGSYYILETQQAPGYNIFPEERRSFTLSSPGQTVDLTGDPFYNDPLGKIRVSKVDDTFNRPMADIQFGLYATEAAANADEGNTGAGALEVLTTDANGLAVSGNLILTGDTTTFYLKELSEPAGFVKSHTVTPVVVGIDNRIDEDNNIIPTAAPFTDQMLGSLRIHKTDSLTGDGLPGAVFSLYEGLEGNVPVGRIGTDTTDANGLATITGLTPGSYWLVEDKAPDGYLQAAAPISVDVAPQVENEVTLADSDGFWYDDVTVINTANPPEELTTGDLLLIKTDGKTGDRLPGATFALYNGDEVKLGEKTSNANGEIVFEGLNVGETYYLVETKAPDGYKLLTSSLPVMMQEADVTAVPVPNDRTPPPPPETGSLRIIKTDSLTGDTLSGAVFSLYSGMEGDAPVGLIGTVTTDANGLATIANLTEGSYWLVEDKAPDGYMALGAPLNVDVGPQKDENNVVLRDANGHWYTTTTVVNTANPPEGLESGDLLITKTDALTGKRLAGATFALYDEDMTLIDTKTTNANGEIVFEGLDPGFSYWLVETKAPKNYILVSEPIPVLMDDTAEVTTVPVTNTYNPPEDIHTGMMDYNFLILGGVALIGGVLLVLFTRKRKAARK